MPQLKVEISRHNGGNNVPVGTLSIDLDRETIIETAEEAVSDLVAVADESTIPEGYEWTGDEVYEIVRDGHKTYTYHEEGGHSEELESVCMEDAISEAEDLARSGDWGHGGASISVWVTETDADGNEIDRRHITVDIDPDHEAMIHEATGGAGCGDSPDDHDWTREGEGGLDENPGVWSTGGTSMVFASHCRRCGLHRTERHTGSQRNPGEHDTVEYEMPDEWTPEE